MPVTRPDDFAFPSPDRNGLTIREHFAGLIMAGFAAEEGRGFSDGGLKSAATEAVRWADALIDALNGGGQNMTGARENAGPSS